jgi:hypothetical protein
MLLICIPILHSSPANPLRVFDDLGVETLGVLDVDGLDVRVQLLLSTVLVVTLTADTDTEAEWDTLDTGFPDLLVELGVEAHILGALEDVSMPSLDTRRQHDTRCGMRPATQMLFTYHSLLSEALDLPDRPGSPLLEAHTVDLLTPVLALCSSSVFRPIPAGKPRRTSETANLSSKYLTYCHPYDCFSQMPLSVYASHRWTSLN